ncbi:MAG: HEPN domain-containing protein [Candidatus Aenigmarchaeota archaeon]|nr:HEPN domain-containing protein [Candidatus Aenigmarchaeota archaeon]
MVLKRFDYDECVKEGLVRNVPPSAEKAEGSINTARKWIEEAEKNFNTEAFKSSVMASYLAMFHSARSIMYYDGLREKSHYCIARYLEDIYVRQGSLERKWVELLDHYRELRHEDQYSINFVVTMDEAETALGKAKQFVDIMEKLLNKISGN